MVVIWRLIDYEGTNDEMLEDDGEVIIDDRQKKLKQAYFDYDLKCDYKSIEWKLGMGFVSPKELHKAVQLYAIYN